MDSRVKQAGRVAVLPSVAVWNAAEVKKRGRCLRVLGKRSAAWTAGAEPAAFCRASGRLRGPCRKPLGGSRSGRALSPWALCAVTNLFLVCYVYCFISENSSDRKRVMTEGRR